MRMHSADRNRQGMGYNMAKRQSIRHNFLRVAALTAVFLMSGLYALLKGCIRENAKKVVFLSRQYNSPSPDFLLLEKTLREKCPGICIVMLTKRLEKGPISMLSFGLVLLRSLWEMASARVCILDTYWPAVSLLRHSDSLLIIQVWHAIGKIKRSGYQTLGLPYGRSRATAELLKMHRGYDFVIAGGEAMNRSYCESFGIKSELLLNYGLPRIDELLTNHEHLQAEFRKAHPEMAGKQLILYVPTFRKEEFSGFSQMIRAFSGPEYQLILRPHIQQPIADRASLSTFEYPGTALNVLLSACDYVITDYSAVLFEAAAIRKKTYLFLPDHAKYVEKNGLNIDPSISLRDIAFTSAEVLRERIAGENYDYTTLDRFALEYLPKELGNAAERISDVVLTGIQQGRAAALREYRRK